MSAVGPKIDDAYWFEFSEELIKASAKKRDEAAAKLQNLVLWLWGIYTGVAAVGFALANKQLSSGETFWIAAASGALIAVYWGTVWVQMPDAFEFDPRSPTEIRQAHDESLRKKHRRLLSTLWMSLAAALLVSVAIVVASMASPPKAQSFQATLAADRTSIAVTANVGHTEPVLLRAASVTAGVRAELDPPLQIGPTAEGLVQTSIPFPFEPRAEVTVSLEWQDADGLAVVLSRVLRAPPAAAPPAD